MLKGIDNDQKILVMQLHCLWCSVYVKLIEFDFLKIYFDHTSMQNTQGIESKAPSGCIGYVATR